MKKRLAPSLLALAGCALAAPSLLSATDPLMKFTAKEAAVLGWRVVDDGVMGGLSKGKFEIVDQDVLKFSGKLSLENNGGFSSIRTASLKKDLSSAAGLIARVKGDGRTYQFRLSTEAKYRGMEISFSADIPTKKGKWMEVKVPFSKFNGSFRGMRLKDAEFKPGEIRRVGFLLGDKKEGDFELRVDWVKTYGEGETAQAKPPNEPPPANRASD